MICRNNKILINYFPKGGDSMNQVTIVGRLVRKPELRETDNKKKMTYITLAINRPFKSINGEYETDFIDCTLWENVAANTVEYCSKGDILSVRGRLQSRMIEKDDTKRYVLEVIGERVTFISNNSSNKESETEN